MKSSPDTWLSPAITDVAAIPGLQDLWAETLGDPRVCIAILDGPVDLSHPCFAGADLNQLNSFFPAAAKGGPASRHGTHVASVIFGRHGGPVTGIAPQCHGLAAPIFGDGRDGSVAPCSQLELARAITQAIQVAKKDAEVIVINISGGQFSPSGVAHPLLADVIRTYSDTNVLIAAAAGNQGCECLHIPGACASVLAVGAMDAQGEPQEFSNWGGAYQTQGVLAHGVAILGAVPGHGTEVSSGTSYATAIVSGVAALLLSLQRKRGHKPNANAVRNAILQSALGCEHQAIPDCRRLLAGRLNIGGAVDLISPRVFTMSNQTDVSSVTTPDVSEAAGAESLSRNRTGSCTPAAVSVGPSGGLSAPAQSRRSPAVMPAACGCGGGGPRQLVYVIGEISHDFGSEARRDRWLALLDHSLTDEALLIHFDPALKGKLGDAPPQSPTRRARPADADHPETEKGKPEDAEALTWLLRFDYTPIYAIQPTGPFASKGYELLREFLKDVVTKRNNHLKAGDPRRLVHVAIPGYIAGQTTLMSGQTVPVIVPVVRGMRNWNVQELAEVVIKEIKRQNPETDPDPEGIINFLNRVYHDYRNLGIAPHDRALNYAATDALVPGTAIVDHLAKGYQLDTIEVTKSGYCRPDSDCWDIRLIFYHPEDQLKRSRKVFLFTVDVSDDIPILVGHTKTFDIR